MKKLRTDQSNDKHRKRHVYRRKTALRRPVFASMENLDNISINTRRFLNRPRRFLLKKCSGNDSRFRRLLKPFRRRSSGNASILCDSTNLSSENKDVRATPKEATIIEEEVSDALVEGEIMNKENSGELENENLCEVSSENLDDMSRENSGLVSNENSAKISIQNSDERLSDVGEDVPAEPVKLDEITTEDVNQSTLESFVSDAIKNESLNETETESADEIVHGAAAEQNRIEVADDSVDETKRKNFLMPKNDNSEESCSSYELRPPSRCKFCRQSIESVVAYSGPPQDSITENEILSLDALKLCEEDEEKPQFKLTEFSVFDGANHLCSFDGNLIQDNVELFFSGFIKPIYDDNPERTGGFPCKKIGPMAQWWIAGFDEGEKVLIGFSTDRCDYYLMRPTSDYAPFMETVTEKIFVTKMVIEFLQSKWREDEVGYEDLLSYLQAREPPGNMTRVDEAKLIAFADFIYDQVLSYESTAEEDEPKLLVDSACMKKLAELGGIELNDKIVRPAKRRKGIWRLKKDDNFIKATTTSLVETVFGSIFNEQMESTTSGSVSIRPCTVRLTKLENLHRYPGNWKIPSIARNPDASFSQLEKESLQKKLIKPCIIRVKPLSYDELNKYLKLRRELQRNGTDFNSKLSAKSTRRKRKLSDEDWESEDYEPRKIKIRAEKIIWQCEPEEIDDKLYYSSVKIGPEYVRVGNFVSMMNDERIGVIKYMWEDDDMEPMGHFQWFLRSSDTILGDVGHKQEIFLTANCEDVSLTEVDKVLSVDRLSFTNWVQMGNFVVPEWLKEKRDLRDTFFYQKSYDEKFGRFLDLPKDEKVPNTCANCGRKRELENREIPLPIGRMEYVSEQKMYSIQKVRWRDTNFSVGSCVFLSSGTLIDSKPIIKEQRTEEKYDEDKYPEKYRKKYTNEEECASAEPFDVGYICEIFSKKPNIRKARDVRLTVKKFYRPHNTHLDASEANREDVNLLYWSEEECWVKFDQVEGKCFVSYEKNLDTSAAEWSTKGPYRFYFAKAYDNKTKNFTKPTGLAMSVGDIKSDDTDANVPYEWPPIERPLRTMDVFAGCGGLSEGLHQSGVSRCLWAIEKFKAPADAFKLNNKDAKVYIADCNALLTKIMEGKDKDLPKRGDVELLCGGPPCQGFSRMNRFKEGVYSKFKNSLVTSYLSYCDYFRPRFFVLENVRDFITTERNMIFKLSLSCLVRMGYQVGFSVLQCGKYGIPQSRRRTIIIAAAPGEILPSFPEPTHSFPLNKFLDVTVDNKKFGSDMHWATTSGPYRVITVSDAISDLPKIENNDLSETMLHKNKPLTHFQKMMRGENRGVGGKLQDHMCKPLTPLILQRISYIPREFGDWRDLPNIEVTLSDGTRTKKLKYTHYDSKYNGSGKGKLRGVCSCASGNRTSKCDPKFKQGNTLIPWCLPHTSRRHNQWSGLYGRLAWNSYFRTVVTNPEPMGKQGRVLHPEQTRVVSIRECARSQGFADSFQFSGDILDKYAQIGNAVAPPLAKAIGFEIRKSVAAKNESKS